MNTTEVHEAVKTSSRKDVYGMNVSKWTYRGVTMHYYQTTKRVAPWQTIVKGKNDSWELIANNKDEMTEWVDEFIDERGYKAEAGNLIHPNR